MLSGKLAQSCTILTRGFGVFGALLSRWPESGLRDKTKAPAPGGIAGPVSRCRGLCLSMSISLSACDDVYHDNDHTNESVQPCNKLDNPVFVCCTVLNGLDGHSCAFEYSTNRVNDTHYDNTGEQQRYTKHTHLLSLRRFLKTCTILSGTTGAIMVAHVCCFLSHQPWWWFA